MELLTCKQVVKPKSAHAYTQRKMEKDGLDSATFILVNKIVGGLAEREEMLKLFEITVKS
jgi:hypothetical protein